MFGTWSKALRSAGIPKIQMQGKGGLSILRALRDILESHPKKEISRALKLQAEYYFGTLQKAIAQSKKDVRVAKGWSIPKILALLIQMHRRGEDLSYANARRNALPLVSAATAYLKSWGKALYRAGIDPNLYFVHHHWRTTTKRRGGTR